MVHLYIHFPFCSSRCAYCDFYSQAGGLKRTGAYVTALEAELRNALAAGGRGREAGGKIGGGNGDGEKDGGKLATLYVGGGTPTLAGPELLGDFLAAASKFISEGAEVTVEANPSTVTRELAESLAAAGVNRISLGAQSFDPVMRRNLGRAGPTEAIAAAVSAFRTAGLANIGIDLMFSIPGQTPGILERDLGKAVALGPEHISCYELTVKAGSGFMRRWRRELAEASTSGRLLYETAVDRLVGVGYRWYETSNFALPGRECRHNLAYWEGRDFIGIGAGAWSSIGSRRWRNAEDVEGYISASESGNWDSMRQYEELDGEQRLRERLLLGLRCDNGVERSRVAATIDEAQENVLLRNGFLANEGGRIFLTRPGRFVANEVCARLLRD